jgi:dihydrofolate reductase
VRTLVLQSFMSLGLVDEYRLWLLPAAAGKGVALFTDFTRLRLRSSAALPSGMLELAYAPAGTGQ